MSYFERHKSFVAIQQSYLFVDWYNDIVGEIILESTDSDKKFESVLKAPLRSPQREVRKWSAIQ